MFDREFFETSFNKHVDEKRKWAALGSVSVKIRLVTNETLFVWSVLEATDGVVVFEIFPRTGKVRETPKEERDLGGPQFDMDRLAVAYHQIADVEITTLAPEDKRAGFQKT